MNRKFKDLEFKNEKNQIDETNFQKKPYLLSVQQANLHKIKD